MSTSTTDRKPKALLLDDDTTVLRLLGTALEARGYEVRAATDGEAGASLLVDELLDLDVLLVDAELPGRDAQRILHLVRWAGGERDLGVVVLSGALEPAAREQLVALGANAVIDRGAGPLAALEAIAALARRGDSESPATRETVSPALLDALLLAMRRSPARPLAAAGA